MYNVDDAAVLLEALDDVRSPTEAHRKQNQVLNQQGAGRFTGVAATCRAWGLIECVPAVEREESEEKLPRKRLRAKGKQVSPLPSRRAKEEAKEEDQWHLGLKSRAYRRTGANEHLGELLQASRDFRQPPEIVDSATLLEMVLWAEEFDQFLWVGRVVVGWGGREGWWGGGWGGGWVEMVLWAEEFDKFLGRRSQTWARQVTYVHIFLRRKLVLGQLSVSPGRTNVQWSKVSVEYLKKMSPDVCEYLSHIPAKWSVADLSRLCTDRDDWGIFVSMFACLWGSVVKAKAYQGHRDKLITLVTSDEFRGAAQDHVQRYGVAAHVLSLVKQLWSLPRRKPGP